MPPRSAGASLSLEAMATELNAAMRGIPFNQDLVPGAVRLVRDSLSQIRRSASQGAYSMGAIAAADVAAGLILHAGAQELWTDLAEFLTDPAVQRDDRSPAFERLAPDASEIPRDARERFKSAANSILETPDRLFETGLVPYPAALRFLAAHGLIDDGDALNLTAKTRWSSWPSGLVRRQPKPSSLYLAGFQVHGCWFLQSS
jgi:hypothetical protein